MASVFASKHKVVMPYQYDCELLVPYLAGGIPSDPNTAEAWIRTKTDTDTDALIRSIVAEVMVDRGIGKEEAIAEVNMLRNLTGFRTDKAKGLFMREYQVLAMLYEAASVCVNEGHLSAGLTWGDPAVTRNQKTLLNWFKEHVSVEPSKLFLGVKEPTRIEQSFPENKRLRIRGIRYTEVVEDAKVTFRVLTDHKFADDEWEHIWVMAEKTIGLGSMRGQGFGRFEVRRWQQIGNGVDPAWKKKLRTKANAAS